MSYTFRLPTNPALAAKHDTAISCPICRAATLRPHFSCLTTRFICPSCNQVQTIGDLAPLLSDDDFEELTRSRRASIQ